jgi:two-component system, OmpR family, sensor histidine kinase MprB
MSFRRRTVLLAAAAVALAVLLASALVYVLTRDELSGQLDASLRARLVPGQKQSIEIRQEEVSPKRRKQLEKAMAALKRKPSGREAGREAGRAESLRVHVERSGGVVPPFIWQQAHADGGPVQYGTGEGNERALAANVKHMGSAAVPVVRAGRGAKPPPGGLGFTGVIRKGPHGADTALSLVVPAAGFGGQTGYAQLVLKDGEVLRTGGEAGLPVSAATRAVAAGKRPSFFSDATVHGSRVRVLTERGPEGSVWQVAASLGDLDSTLKQLLLVLAAVSLGGILLAAALGLLVSRAALAPVRRLTGASEEVASTLDLAHRIPVRSGDELGRLARSFNTMLSALERSRLAQRQLISDASHELRTPLTSVQANLDALAHGDALSPQERKQAVSAAQAQLRELTVLVGDLVDLSKTEVEEVEVEDVRLDLAVAAALKRARLHAPQVHFELVADPCLVRASPARLDRAIVNLLDNAIKWSPPAGVVEVLVKGGRLEVRDHGPGIAAEDLPRVFDRFYRARAARGRPGSGLGLAIVRQFAETHRGTVRAENDRGGGARLILELRSLPIGATELSEQAGLQAGLQEPPLLPSASSHLHPA